MATANEELLDATLRHQIGVRRFSSGLTKRVALLLERADRDLALKLRERLQGFAGKPVDFTSQRWKAMLKDIRLARHVAIQEYKTLVRSELGSLGKLEGAVEEDILTSAIPIEVSFATVAADQLRAIATSQPFQGRFLREWFNRLERNDQQRIQQALQLGMVEGEPIENIVRRIVGTRAKGFADGILAINRRDAQAVVRTAVNHVSNRARGFVMEANSDIISAQIWTATLDGRTSVICRGRDGKGKPTGNKPLPEGVEPLVPKNAQLPAHVNERSIWAGYIDGVGLVGQRPTVTDTRTPRKREIDFRAEARRTGRPIQDIRREWAENSVGRVPAKTTYQEFLGRQPAAFQDEVLGQTKGKLFRDGGLDLDQYIDRAGNELTLGELAATQPKAFKKAGLNPADF